MSRLGMCAETIPLLQSVEMGVEILEAMDECATSQKSVEIIRQYLRDFRASGASQPPGDDEAQSEAGQVFDVPVCIIVLFS